MIGNSTLNRSLLMFYRLHAINRPSAFLIGNPEKDLFETETLSHHIMYTVK